MEMVNIDGTWHQADEAVVKRMGEYYDTMVKAIAKIDKITAAGLNVRDAQKKYFRTRDKVTDLPRSKALEREFDDLLAGKTKPEGIQVNLFQ